MQNLPVDDGDPAAPPTEGREVAPGHFERPAANALMVVANRADSPAPPPTTNPGTGSGAGSGAGGTTATTAPAKLTTAGGGPAPFHRASGRPDRHVRHVAPPGRR